MSVTVGEIVRSAPDLRGYCNSGKNDDDYIVRAVGKCETSETCSYSLNGEDGFLNVVFTIYLQKTS